MPSMSHLHLHVLSPVRPLCLPIANLYTLASKLMVTALPAMLSRYATSTCGGRCPTTPQQCVMPSGHACVCCQALLRALLAAYVNLPPASVLKLA